MLDDFFQEDELSKELITLKTVWAKFKERIADNKVGMKHLRAWARDFLKTKFVKNCHKADCITGYKIRL